MTAKNTKPTSASYAASRDWPGYFESVAGKDPRDTLLQALDLMDQDGLGHEPPLALDLGAGEGRDTAEVLRRGWRVIAFEPDPDGIRRITERNDHQHADRLEVRPQSFETMQLPMARLINASFSLPFCPPEHFDAAWSKIIAAIEPGGLFVGQLFGDRDSWASIQDRSHQTKEQALVMLDGLKVLRFDEEERDGEDCSSTPKHWHIFHIIARKPGTPQ